MNILQQKTICRLCKQMVYGHLCAMSKMLLKNNSWRHFGYGKILLSQDSLKETMLISEFFPFLASCTFLGPDSYRYKKDSVKICLIKLQRISSALEDGNLLPPSCCHSTQVFKHLWKPPCYKPRPWSVKTADCMVYVAMYTCCFSWSHLSLPCSIWNMVSTIPGKLLSM